MYASVFPHPLLVCNEHVESICMYVLVVHKGESKQSDPGRALAQYEDS